MVTHVAILARAASGLSLLPTHPFLFQPFSRMVASLLASAKRLSVDTQASIWGEVCEALAPACPPDAAPPTESVLECLTKGPLHHTPPPEGGWDLC